MATFQHPKFTCLPPLPLPFNLKFHHYPPSDYTNSLSSNVCPRYYVWPIGEEKPKPLPLIPESQFIDLLHDIDGAFPRLRLQHRVKDYREALVILDFPDHPDLKPRFLGETTSRANYDTLYNLMPNQQYRPRGEKPAAGPPHSKTLEAFKQMMEETAELTKSKNKAARGRRKEDRIYRQRLIIKQMKRAQRYLGLRPKSDKRERYLPERLFYRDMV